MRLPTVDPGLFADAQSIATLKREAAAHDPQALKTAARQFESLFLEMMLKSAQAANFKDPLFGSSQSRFYQDLYDQQLSIQLSKTHTFGLAEMLTQQLRRQWSGGGASGGARASSAAQTPGPTRLGAPTSGTTQAPGRTSLPTPATASPPVVIGGAATPAAAHAAQGGPTVSPTEQTAFARALWPDAEQAAQRLGVSPVGLIAQAALETDWGRRLPRTAAGASSNNLFGIKAGAGWAGASVSAGTQEYVNGSATAVQAPFRAYGSCGQCFQDYTRLLSGNPRYAAALGTGNDIGAFASALQQAGYATDPHYARKLTAVAATLNRTLGAASGPAPLKPATIVPIYNGTSTL